MSLRDSQNEKKMWPSVKRKKSEKYQKGKKMVKIAGKVLSVDGIKRKETRRNCPCEFGSPKSEFTTDSSSKKATPGGSGD